MTHVVFRCDATPHGGVGHLVRVISVADAARAVGHTVAIAGSIEAPLAQQLVAEAGIPVTAASDDLSIVAAEQGATVVHVDDYSVGTSALQQVRSTGAILSSMEDGKYGRRPADVVVDSTIRAEHLERPDDGSTWVLAGIRYAPMRKEVTEARNARATQEAAAAHAGRDHLLIVMGGTDATGAAATIAEACHALPSDPRITVIAPRDKWESIRSVAPRADLVEPSNQFLKLAAEATLVISASGTTAWELACIGVPTLLVAVVDNQLAGYEAALASNIARGLGTLQEIRDDPAAIAERIGSVLTDVRAGRITTDAGMALVDGQGAARIVEAWRQHLAAPTDSKLSGLAARNAAPEDSARLLRWRNDPVTREVSRSHDVVDWRSHQAWYEGVLAANNRILYVIEYGGTPIGTVRFDAVEADEWEVSITLAPERRGEGLAGPVLACGLEAFDAASHASTTIIAAVHPDNEPSQKLFSRAGFVLDPNRDDGEFDVLVRQGPS